MFKVLDEMGVTIDGESTSAFFARQLEHVKGQAYDVIRAPLRAFELIPTDSTAGPGAETVVYEQFDDTGVAKIISNYADDLPRNDVKGKEFVAHIRSHGAAYGYNLQEIRNAQMANRNLQTRKMNSAVRSHRELINQIAFYGDSEHNLQGWLTNPNLPSETVADPGAGTNWFDGSGAANKTADEILADMNAVSNRPKSNTNGAEEANTLAMPLDHYSYIHSTRIPDTNITIAEFFLDNNPFIDQIEWCQELSEENRQAALGTDDPYDGDIMIAYDRSPEKFTLELPIIFEQFPAQQRNLEFVVPTHGRIAGVLIYYPFSQNVGEGI